MCAQNSAIGITLSGWIGYFRSASISTQSPGDRSYCQNFHPFLALPQTFSAALEVELKISPFSPIVPPLRTRALTHLLLYRPRNYMPKKGHQLFPCPLFALFSRVPYRGRLCRSHATARQIADPPPSGGRRGCRPRGGTDALERPRVDDRARTFQGRGRHLGARIQAPVLVGRSPGERPWRKQGNKPRKHWKLRANRASMYP
jgi:hypothetical protein